MAHPTIPDRTLSWCLVALGCVGGAIAALLAGQDAGFDVRNYHWYNAWALLGGRMDTDVAPAQLQTWFNPVLDILYYGALTLAGPRGGAAALGAIQGVAAGLVGVLAVRIIPSTRGRLLLAGLCTVAALGGPVVRDGIGGSQGDLVIAGLVLGGVLALLSGRPAVWGALTGFALGLKPTAAPFVFGGVVLLPLIGGRAAVLVGGAGGLCGWLLGGGWWAWVLAHHFGNPVFPMLNDLFGSPWAAPEHFLDQGYFPSGADWVLLPLRMALGGDVSWDAEWRDARLLGLAVVAAIWLWRRRDTPDRAIDHLLLWAGVVYMTWLGGSAMVRYVAPLLLVSPALVLAVCLRTLPLRVAGPIGAACIVGVAAWARPPAPARVPFGATPFGVVLPPSGARIDAVVTAGDSAISYLATAFPPSVRHVRIVSSVLWHEDETRLHARARRILHGSERIALLTGPDGETTPDALHSFGLVADLERCEPVGSAVDDGVLLCPVSRADTARRSPRLHREAATPSRGDRTPPVD